MSRHLECDSCDEVILTVPDWHEHQEDRHPEYAHEMRLRHDMYDFFAQRLETDSLEELVEWIHIGVRKKDDELAEFMLGSLKLYFYYQEAMKEVEERQSYVWN